MNTNPLHIDSDIIRDTVLFKMVDDFTINDVIKKIERAYEEPINPMTVNVYLTKISRLGLLEQHGKKYRINTPDIKA